jgi:hypothetical protein
MVRFQPNHNRPLPQQCVTHRTTSPVGLAASVCLEFTQSVCALVGCFRRDGADPTPTRASGLPFDVRQ